jgi:hypothetical protein
MRLPAWRIRLCKTIEDVVYKSDCRGGLNSNIQIVWLHDTIFFLKFKISGLVFRAVWWEVLQIVFLSVSQHDGPRFIE